MSVIAIDSQEMSMPVTKMTRLMAAKNKLKKARFSSGRSASLLDAEGEQRRLDPARADGDQVERREEDGELGLGRRCARRPHLARRPGPQRRHRRGHGEQHQALPPVDRLIN